MGRAPRPFPVRIAGRTAMGGGFRNLVRVDPLRRPLERTSRHTEVGQGLLAGATLGLAEDPEYDLADLDLDRLFHRLAVDRRPTRDRNGRHIAFPTAADLG